MELVTWIPFLAMLLVLAAVFAPHSARPHRGRHYSRVDRRRFCR
ncbi:MAG TPA: hypothetical protein VFM13_04290 [Gaiellaceae bacterium]|nr:hypothetical protein [Gaiellaceae bacterium]